MEQTVRPETKGWLQISTAGFAALNQSRPQEHLVKELVQNALDAVEENSGTVEVAYHHDGRDFVVTCRDTGTGIADLSALRVDRPRNGARVHSIRGLLLGHPYSPLNRSHSR